MATPTSCPKVVPFPQPQPQPRQSQPPIPPVYERERDNGYNNNYIRAGAREIVGLDARQAALAQVSQAFAICLGYMPSRYVIDRAAEYLAQGVAPDLLVAVLEYTTRAPRPSWAYACTVLERNVAQGVTSAAAFAAALASYRTAARKKAQNGAYNAFGGSCYGQKRVIEQCYAQRNYDPAEVDGPSPEDIYEASLL